MDGLIGRCMHLVGRMHRSWWVANPMRLTNGTADSIDWSLAKPSDNALNNGVGHHDVCSIVNIHQHQMMIG